MGAVVGSVRVLFQGDTGGIEKATKGVVKQLDMLKGTATNALSFAGISLGVAGFIELVNQADDAKGAIDNLRNTFGKYADSVEARTMSIARGMGESIQAISEGGARAGAMLQELGYDAQTTARVTSELMLRAADAAGAWNTTTEEALDAFNNAIKGRATGLAKYGIVINDAIIDQQLLAIGAEKINNEWTQEQKNLGMVQALLSQTGKMAGEAQEETALASKRIAQAIADVQRLGQELTGFFKDDIERVSKLVRTVTFLVDKLKDLGGAFMPGFDSKKSEEFGKGLNDIWRGNPDEFKQSDMTDVMKKQAAALNEINRARAAGLDATEQQKKAEKDLAKEYQHTIDEGIQKQRDLLEDAQRFSEDLAGKVVQLRLNVSDDAMQLFKLVERGLDPARAMELAGMADEIQAREQAKDATTQIEARFASFDQAGSQGAWQSELFARTHVPGLSEQQATAKNTSTMVQQLERILAVWNKTRGGGEAAGLDDA